MLFEGRQWKRGDVAYLLYRGGGSGGVQVTDISPALQTNQSKDPAVDSTGPGATGIPETVLTEEAVLTFL